jgi:hypothetical protein
MRTASARKLVSRAPRETGALQLSPVGVVFRIMRILKVAIAGLVTALAMFFSLMVALGVAVIGVGVYLYLRLRGRPANGPFRQPPARQPTHQTESDVIDVTATEVRPDKPER